MQFMKRKHEVVLSEGQREVRFLGTTQSQSRLSDAESNSSRPTEGRGDEREMDGLSRLVCGNVSDLGLTPGKVKSPDVTPLTLTF